MHQHPHAGFGFEEPCSFWELSSIEIAPPVVAGNGGQMRIPEERPKRDQLTIVESVDRLGLIVDEPSRRSK